MLDKLLNMVLWVDAAFTRTRDPLLAEYRGYQRHMIIGGVLAIMWLMGAWLLMPSNEPLDALQQLTQKLGGYAALACFAMSVVSLLWCVWAAYRLWRFIDN